MGAVPTLGGILRMPVSKSQLTATASPAARELLRRCGAFLRIVSVACASLTPCELRLTVSQPQHCWRHTYRWYGSIGAGAACVGSACGKFS